MQWNKSKKVKKVSVKIGAFVNVKIGRAKAYGVIQEARHDDVLGKFYKVEVISCSKGMKERVDNDAIWACFDEVIKV